LGRHECQALVMSELLEYILVFHVSSSLPYCGKSVLSDFTRSSGS
jgi:hypothetical protein